MRLTTTLLLLLPGCATLGIPAPWHSTEEVTEIADTVAVERVTVLAAAIEEDIAPLPSLEIPPPYEAPAPAPADEGGPGWLAVLGIAAAAFFGRGIPSKGPLLKGAQLVGHAAKAVFGRPKPPPPPTA